MKLYQAVRAAFDLNGSSAVLKQSLTAIGFVVALVIAFVLPEIELAGNVAILGATLIMALATGIAVFFTAYPSLARFAILVPCIDFIALGLLRFGFGDYGSLVGSLIILPVIWIASEDGRRYILLSAVGTSFALIGPTFATGEPLTQPVDWLRGVFTPIVFAAAGIIVNELSRKARHQVESIHDLAMEREEMLTAAVGQAERLRRNEKRRRAADQLTRSVLDALTEQSVIGTDVTGLIDVWNPGAVRMLGAASTEVQGVRSIYEFHVNDELQQRSRDLNYPPGETVLNPGFSALVESARLGRPEVRSWTYVRADGTTLPVEVAVTRRVDAEGVTAGYIFVATDVTQALEVSRIKDEFVGLVSHELRTPLSSILGYLDLMRDDDDNPLSDEQRQYLAIADRNAQRLLRLVGDLLFTAQVGHSTFAVDATDVDLAPVIEASVDSSTPAATAAGVEVTLEIADDIGTVWGDGVRLGQACDNLLSNAIKFTPRGGRVSITASNEGDNLVIAITDTGMGIPDMELDQLFERFFRASTAVRAAVPGVGLGLSITKAIVDAHHGELDVTSEEGVGTTFIVRLPLSTVQLPQPRLVE